MSASLPVHDPTVEEGLALEGTIKSMPRLAKSRPSDRAARRKALEGRLRVATEKATAEAALPLIHGRCCIMGLMVLELLRGAAWWQGTIPGYSVFGMHFLTTTSDIACIICAFPLFATGIAGQCVQLGCLGPMLTLVFAMSLVDVSALGAYLVVATPRPLSPGAKSAVDALEACVGVWEFALVASVALQMALCASSWRVYRELRMNGLYPPGSDPAGVGKMREISIMEVMCEAEDVELLADCEVNCDNSLKTPLVEAITPAAHPTDAPMSPTPISKADPQEARHKEHGADDMVEVDEATVKVVKSPIPPPSAAQPPVAAGEDSELSSACACSVLREEETEPRLEPVPGREPEDSAPKTQQVPASGPLPPGSVPLHPNSAASPPCEAGKEDAEAVAREESTRNSTTAES